MDKTPDPIEEVDTAVSGEATPEPTLRLWRRMWRRTPKSVRKGIVLVIGVTLLVLGALLVVLPGPFTVPLVVAGLVVLGTEFAWARSILERGRNGMKRVLRR